MITNDLWKHTLALLHQLRRRAIEENNKGLQEELAELFPKLEMAHKVYKCSDAAQVEHLQRLATGRAGYWNAPAPLTNDQMLALMRPHLDEGDGGYICDLQPANVIAAGRAIEKHLLSSILKEI